MKTIVREKTVWYNEFCRDKNIVSVGSPNTSNFIWISVTSPPGVVRLNQEKKSEKKKGR